MYLSENMRKRIFSLPNGWKLMILTYYGFLRWYNGWKYFLLQIRANLAAEWLKTWDFIRKHREFRPKFLVPVLDLAFALELDGQQKIDYFLSMGVSTAPTALLRAP